MCGAGFVQSWRHMSRKDLWIRTRAAAEDVQLLTTLATAMGRTEADAVRVAIREAAQARNIALARPAPAEAKRAA